MIAVRAIREDERAGYQLGHSVSQYAFEKDGRLIAFAGVNAQSLTSDEGWPWMRPVNLGLLSRRELLILAREALKLWSEQYSTLYACANMGENVSWFKFMGFRVDSTRKGPYGTTIMRYEK